MHMQSIPVEGGPAWVRTSPLPPPTDADLRPHGASSSFGLLSASTARYPDSPCIGWRPPRPADAPPVDASAPPDTSRPYAWWSYREVLAHAASVGAGLVAKFGLKKGDRVGLYAKNCPWWTVAMYACNGQGIVIVPIYDTLGEDIVEYVCGHAGVKVVLVSEGNAVKLGKAMAKCEGVQGVVVIEGHGEVVAGDTCMKIAAEGFGGSECATVVMEDICRAGEGAGEGDADPAGWDELYCILYTSGTTGKPKGVTLSNRAIMSSVSSAFQFFEHVGQGFSSTDSTLCYLPLSHIFEQQAQALMIGCGGKVGFFTGDIKLLSDDLMALKPTVFVGVPRIYARFQEKIAAGAADGGYIKRKLFEWAYTRQLTAEQNPNDVARSSIWDTLVMSKVKARILPAARLCITGSAPLSGETNDFLKVCLACPVAQGYGLTETVGGAVCSYPGKSVSGTCGGPLPGITIKLVDLPEMGYLTSDEPQPRGEVYIKGPIVTSGYYNNEEATADAMDGEWFRSGDVGSWTEDGALKIIDRAKNLFKLSQGEYVSPEAIEIELVKSKLVGQIFVYGNSLESTLLAVVVPDIPATKEWGKSNGAGTFDINQIAAKPEFKKEVMSQLLAQAKKAKLKKYEYIKDIIFETELNDLGMGFHVDNNLSTPTFKLKRPQLNIKYKARLDGMYAELK